MITIDDVKAYSGIDYADDMVNANLTRIIKTADAYVKGWVGDNYSADDPRAVELLLMICDTLYTDRGLSARAENNYKKLANDLALQLQCELRRGSSA